MPLVHGLTPEEKYSSQELADRYYHAFFVDLLDAIALENTGKPGAWAQVRSRQAREDLVRRIVAAAKITVGVAAIGALAALLNERLDRMEGAESQRSP